MDTEKALRTIKELRNDCEYIGNNLEDLKTNRFNRLRHFNDELRVIVKAINENAKIITMANTEAFKKCSALHFSRDDCIKFNIPKMFGISPNTTISFYYKIDKNSISFSYKAMTSFTERGFNTMVAYLVKIIEELKVLIFDEIIRRLQGVFTLRRDDFKHATNINTEVN